MLDKAPPRGIDRAVVFEELNEIVDCGVLLFRFDAMRFTDMGEVFLEYDAGGEGAPQWERPLAVHSVLSQTPRSGAPEGNPSRHLYR